jgi:DNA-binding response OmpR family regulator
LAEDKKKILVVEDDQDGLHILCMMLERIGYAPIPFSSSVEALEKSKELKVDLVLLDINMPHLNGYELLKELKKQDSFKGVPIIMVTARDDESDVIQGYQYGADYYMIKPFTPKQLENGLRLFL